MATLGFKDNDGVDVGDKYVTKEYLLDRYPNIATHSNMPTLWTWGDNTSGSLGDGTTTSRSSPNTTTGAGSNWKTIAVSAHVLAVKNDGTLWTWGAGAYGVLGIGSTASRSSPGTTVVAGTTWGNVAAGDRFSASIKNDGTLWTWGRNNVGQLGTGNVTSRSSPNTTAAALVGDWQRIACGYEHVVAVKTNGSLFSWGRNTSGALGSGTTTSRSSPVSIAGSTWTTVAAGFNCSAATKNDGTLWLWGDNTKGQLGDGTTTNRSSPVTTTVAGTTWKQVAIGRVSTAAVKNDGSLWTWGDNSTGTLGNGTTTDRSSPNTVVGAGLNWNRVAVGQLSATGGGFAMAIKNDGTLWTWGSNANGQLGDNTTTNRSSPVTTITGGNNWKVIAAGWGTNPVATREEDDW
jgi:alpha-tubulin suppressor-like RCC1 family protein